MDYRTTELIIVELNGSLLIFSVLGSPAEAGVVLSLTDETANHLHTAAVYD